MREYNNFNFKRKKRDNIKNQIIKEKKNEQLDGIIIIIILYFAYGFKFSRF